MPVIPPGSLLRDPCLVVTTAQRYGLGWQDARKTGPCFVVAQVSAMGSKKVLDRFPVTEDGWARAWAALTGLDPRAAQATAGVLAERAEADAGRRAEKDRQTRMYEAAVRAGSVTRFPALGVQVLAGDEHVYTIGSRSPAAKTDTSRLLGSLPGAEAMVTDGAQAWSPGRAMFLPIRLAALATQTKADAAIVFGDGTVHTAALDGNNAVREAQLQVVQFNALAGGPAAAPQAADIGTDPVIKLRKLRELLKAGLISQAEYDSKRAQVIESL
jgi:Short C-terminal domain